jgi:hypothetical protein
VKAACQQAVRTSYPNKRLPETVKGHAMETGDVGWDRVDYSLGIDYFVGRIWQCKNRTFSKDKKMRSSKRKKNTYPANNAPTAIFYIQKMMLR